MKRVLNFRSEPEMGQVKEPLTKDEIEQIKYQRSIIREEFCLEGKQQRYNQKRKRF